MRFIGTAIEKLQRHPKRIVFPEGAEPTVLQAARQFQSLRLGAPILLGDRAKVKKAADKLNISLDHIRVINPAESEELETFTQRYVALRRSKGLRKTEAREALLQPNFFGAMMVATHQADGLVSGACHSTGSVLRSLTQIFKVAPQASVASGCMVLELEDTRFGDNGVLFMGDCGVITDPTVEELAEVALDTAQFARHLLNTRPRVAFLSFTTKSRDTHPSVGKVQAAAALAQKRAAQKFLPADFDGELQADAALIPDIASRKGAGTKVAGRANVLIFPDLNSGNIASKLVRHLARTNAYGHILLGLDRPAADVARGSNSHDIMGVAAIIGVQAIAYNQLYPAAGATLPAG